MRYALLLLVTLAFPHGASAQDFDIRSVEIREPTPEQVEVVATIQNHRRTASNYSVLVEIPGAATYPMMSSRERLAPNATSEVVLRFDATGYTRPLTATVVVRNHRREVTDREPFTLAPRPSPPSTVPASVEMRTEMIASIPAIAEQEVSEVTLRITTGSDDRRQGTIVFASVFDMDGTKITTSNGIVRGSFVIASRDTPTWASGSVQTVRVPLLEPIAPSDIDRLELVLATGPDYRPFGSDQWDVNRVEVEAGGNEVGRVEGAPFHRFNHEGRERTIQLHPPDPGRRINVVKVVLNTGGDDKRAASHVRFQAFDREGHPLNAAPYENHWITTDPLPTWSSKATSWYLDRPVSAREVGTIVIEHESVRTGPFDQADDWTLSGLDVLLYSGSDAEPATERVTATASGTPLYRFSGDRRRFVFHLPE